jgi:hypothetical protein
MPELIIDIFKQINIGQLIAMGVMLWFFYSRLDGKLDKVNERIDRLSDKVDDIDRRLCRIEGSLATQGHCLFSNQNTPKDKAE